MLQKVAKWADRVLGGSCFCERVQGIPQVTNPERSILCEVITKSSEVKVSNVMESQGYLELPGLTMSIGNEPA